MSRLKLSYQDTLIEVGCDEVGRGYLAGPVVAAAVNLSSDFSHPLLNDSKKVSKKNLLILEEYIKKESISWAIGEVDHKEIDEVNILNASFLAMHRAINNLDIKPEFILVDGNRFNKFEDLPHKCIIKGDSKYMNIAAASILAKTYRDRYMSKLGELFPFYDWKNNMGYPTKKHREGILKHGISSHHRLSFKLIPDYNQLSIKF